MSQCSKMFHCLVCGLNIIDINKCLIVTFRVMSDARIGNAGFLEKKGQRIMTLAADEYNAIKMPTAQHIEEHSFLHIAQTEREHGKVSPLGTHLTDALTKGSKDRICQ